MKFKYAFALILISYMSVAQARFWDFLFKSQAAVKATSGQWVEAKERLNRLLVENPQSADILYDLGIASFELKEFDNAFTYFDQACAYAARSSVLYEQALFNKANTAVQLGSLGQALVLFDEVLFLNPSNECARHNREVVQQMINDMQKQEQALQEQHDKQDKQEQESQTQDDQQAGCQQQSCQTGAAESQSSGQQAGQQDGQQQGGQSQNSQQDGTNGQSDEGGDSQSGKDDEGQESSGTQGSPNFISGRHHSFKPHPQSSRDQSSEQTQPDKSDTSEDSDKSDGLTNQVGDNNTDDGWDGQHARGSQQHHEDNGEGDGNEQSKDYAAKEKQADTADDQNGQHGLSSQKSSHTQDTQGDAQSQENQTEKVLLTSDADDKRVQKQLIKQTIRKHMGSNDNKKENMW